VGTTLRAWRNW